MHIVFQEYNPLNLLKHKIQTHKTPTPPSIDAASVLGECMRIVCASVCNQAGETSTVPAFCDQRNVRTVSFRYGWLTMEASRSFQYCNLSEYRDTKKHTNRNGCIPSSVLRRDGRNNA
jgi:hypothetical protein